MSQPFPLRPELILLSWVDAVQVCEHCQLVSLSWASSSLMILKVYRTVIVTHFTPYLDKNYPLYWDSPLNSTNTNYFLASHLALYASAWRFILQSDNRIPHADLCGSQHLHLRVLSILCCRIMCILRCRKPKSQKTKQTSGREEVFGDVSHLASQHTTRNIKFVVSNMLQGWYYLQMFSAAATSTAHFQYRHSSNYTVSYTGSYVGG